MSTWAIGRLTDNMDNVIGFRLYDCDTQEYRNERLENIRYNQERGIRVENLTVYRDLAYDGVNCRLDNLHKKLFRESEDSRIGDESVGARVAIQFDGSCVEVIRYDRGTAWVTIDDLLKAAQINRIVREAELNLKQRFNRPGKITTYEYELSGLAAKIEQISKGLKGEFDVIYYEISNDALCCLGDIANFNIGRDTNGNIIFEPLDENFKKVELAPIEKLETSLSAYRMLGLTKNDINIDFSRRAMVIDVGIMSSGIIVPDGITTCLLCCNDDDVDYMLEKIVLPSSCHTVGGTNRLYNDSTCKINEVNFENVRTISNCGMMNTSIERFENLHSLRVIEKEAFRKCDLLTYVDLSDSKITAVGENVFASCARLEEVKLNKECKLIDYGAFQSCGKLRKINTENVMTIKDYAFGGTGIEEIDLTNITRIGEETFLDCKKLTRLLNTQRLKFIGPFAFDRAERLVTNEHTFENVEHICRGAFRMCYNLDEVWFPSIKQIEADAFKQSSVSSIHIGKNIEKIDGDAFSECTRIQVYFEELKRISALAMAKLKKNVEDIGGSIYVRGERV